MLENHTLQSIALLINDHYILEAIYGAIAGGLYEYLKLKELSRMRVFCISASITAILLLISLFFGYFFIHREWPSPGLIILLPVIAFGLASIYAFYCGISKESSK